MPSLPHSLTLPAVITVGMLMRGKANSLSKEVSVPESIRAVYLCQINRLLYLYVSVKQDNLIIYEVFRFPNLFGNFNWFIFVWNKVDSCDIDMYLYLLIFIPPWYFESRKSVYPNTGVCSSKRSKNLHKKVALSLSLKWPLNCLLPVFPSISHTYNEWQKILPSNP